MPFRTIGRGKVELIGLEEELRGLDRLARGASLTGNGGAEPVARMLADTFNAEP